jgi:hypothetical protein
VVLRKQIANCIELVQAVLLTFVVEFQGASLWARNCLPVLITSRHNERSLTTVMVCQLAVALCAICPAGRVVGGRRVRSDASRFQRTEVHLVVARRIGALELFKQERERDLLNGVRINFSFADSI